MVHKDRAYTCKDLVQGIWGALLNFVFLSADHELTILSILFTRTSLNLCNKYFLFLFLMQVVCHSFFCYIPFHNVITPFFPIGPRCSFKTFNDNHHDYLSLATFSLPSAFVSIKTAIDDVIECHQWKLHRIKSYKFSLRADVQYGAQLIRQHAPPPCTPTHALPEICQCASKWHASTTTATQTETMMMQ